MEFVGEQVADIDLTDRTVLEVGSYDVNGSIRSLIEPEAFSYIGCDIRPGPGVDKVIDEEVCNYEILGTFDLVVSTEMLEHAYSWRDALQGIVKATKLGGNIILTTRGPGAGRHEHPEDHWRFTCELIEAAFSRLGVVGTVRNDHGAGYENGVFFEGTRVTVMGDDLLEFEAEAAPPPWYA